VVLEMPGVDRDNIDVNVENGQRGSARGTRRIVLTEKWYNQSFHTIIMLSGASVLPKAVADALRALPRQLSGSCVLPPRRSAGNR
jgi:hypothetical protein